MSFTLHLDPAHAVPTDRRPTGDRPATGSARFGPVSSRVVLSDTWHPGEGARRRIPSVSRHGSTRSNEGRAVRGRETARMTNRQGPDRRSTVPGSQLDWERVLVAGPGSTAFAADLARLTAQGLVSTEAATAAGHRIGALLVDAGHFHADVVQRVVTMLARSGSVAGTLPPGLPDLLGAVAAGHAAAAQGLLLRQAQVAGAAGTAAREETERALHDSQARFYALFRDAVVGIGIGDMDGRILEVNESFQEILGYSLEEFRGLSIRNLVHPDDDAAIWRDYEALVTGEIEAFRAEKPYRHRDGHVVWTDLTVSLVRDATGLPQFQVAIVEDITDRRRLQEELVHQATHDSLTGLPNRALFLQRLADAVGASDPQQRVAVLFLDLDSFKFVNDSRGHFAGDQVLTVAARRIAAAAARHGAFTARLAGDEFVVLVSGGGSARNAAGAELADELLAALDPPIAVEGQQPVHVTAGVGVVDVAAGDLDAEGVLRTADLALHAAKEDGKGQVVAHDPSRTARQLPRFRIAADLPGALDRGELTLVYQPLVRLDTGLPHSAEALLRWNHPQLGQITPDRFVPVAEDSQVIVPLGRWVLEQACQDLAASPWPSVNINVSVRQLYSPTLVDDVKRCLHDNALAPHRLRVEVTESVIVDEDGAGPLGALRQLAELGVRIVMDDFGTGYSNLAALRLLPLHEIKLAGTFLSGLRPGTPPDPVDRRILATLVDLAHALGLVVTAENIETREQDQQVRALGCDVGQGHYYGAPGPAIRRRPWLHVLE